MKWGIQTHEALEARIKHGRPFPDTMPFEKFAAPLIAAGARAELPLAITREGEACDFWDKAAYVRGKLDAPVIKNTQAAIFDLKTGKVREDPEELKIHAVLLKAWQPTLQRIVGYYMWTQTGEVGKMHDLSNTQETLAGITYTMQDVARCMEVEDFPKRRNPLCDYCPVVDCENRGNWKRGR